MSDWCRPADLAYPNVWDRFVGRAREDGKVLEYWVQDLTEEHVDEAIGYLMSGFVNDEPLCKYLELENDDAALKELEQLYRHTFAQKCGLVCLTVDKNTNVTKMVGFNCTGRAFKEQPKYQCTNPKIETFCDYEEHYISGFKDQYEILKIDQYLSAIGLYVKPDYRGEGIGLRILNAREIMCKAIGIPVSCTLFTSLASQRLAERAGFKDLIPLKRIENNFMPDSVEMKLMELGKGYRYMYKFYL